MEKIVDLEYLAMLSAKGIYERNKILEIEKNLIELNRIKEEAEMKALNISIAEEVFNRIKDGCINRAKLGHNFYVVDSYITIINNGNQMKFKEPLYWKNLFGMLEENNIEYKASTQPFWNDDEFGNPHTTSKHETVIIINF